MLRAPAEHIIIDSISDTTVLVDADGLISIEGYGIIDPDTVLECWNECPAACTPAIRTVTVTIPETCECPYEYAIRVRAIPCTWKYDVQSTFGSESVYSYVSPDGSVPTATVVKDALVAQINADQFGKVTAASTGAATFTVTEKDCDGLLGSCGIEVYTTAGSGVAVTQAHVDPVFPAFRLKQTFPIKWGSAGTDPKLARCGTYCVFYLHLRGDDIQDIDMNRTYGEYDREVYFYVNSEDANYESGWLDLLVDELDCFTT